MLLMRAAYITLASERGLGPGHFDWWAPNQFPGPNPLPLALVMDVARIKALCMWPYKSWVAIISSELGGMQIFFLDSNIGFKYVFLGEREIRLQQRLHNIKQFLAQNKIKKE